MNLLIVDDHPLFRQGLRLLLQTMSSEASVDEAGGLAETLVKVRSGACDLIFLDLRMPGVRGMAALDALRTELPDVPLVVISGEHDPQTVRDSVERGAMGFIPKSLTPERLVEALRQVLDHKVYLPDDALLGPIADAGEVFPELTSRQIDVLRCVVQGKSNKMVARELGVSAETVKSHLAAAMHALNVNNRTELVYVAARRGLPLG